MTKADENTAWRAKVHQLLGDGWGVEDISIMLSCDVDHVRREVQILRDSGRLERVVRP